MTDQERLRQLERDVPALINCVRYLANEIGEINPGVADAMKQRVELMLNAAKPHVCRFLPCDDHPATCVCGKQEYETT